MREIGLDFPASDAVPPILPDEAKAAATAVCRLHGGFRAGSLYGDREGAVLFCPLGKSYWRFTTRRGGMHERLAWPKGM